MVNVRLIPEAALAAHHAALDADPKAYDGYRDDLLTDPVCATALRNYVLLTHHTELVAYLGLSDEDLFWNRYYWFLRLKCLHEYAEHGGQECVPMAQQAFDMMAEPDCEVDYENLQPVEELAGRDAAAQLATLPPANPPRSCGS